MKIELSFSAGQFDDLQLRDKNVVVIDVLRASSTITVALNNGAREIIPVASIESAVKISGSLFGEVTLRGGERNGKTIEGFNLGNSPLRIQRNCRKREIYYLLYNKWFGCNGEEPICTCISDWLLSEPNELWWISSGKRTKIFYLSVPAE